MGGGTGKAHGLGVRRGARGGGDTPHLIGIHEAGEPLLLGPGDALRRAAPDFSAEADAMLEIFARA